MRHLGDCLGSLLVACLAITQVAGCCCHNPCVGCSQEMSCSPCGQPYQLASPACYGYHSTCWSPWPEECETCPPPLSYSATADLSEVPKQSSAPKVSKEMVPGNPQPRRSKNSDQVKPATAPETIEPESDSSSQFSSSSEEPSAQSRPGEAKPAAPSDLENQQGQQGPTSKSEPVPSAFEARRATYQEFKVSPVVVEAAQEK